MYSPHASETPVGNPTTRSRGRGTNAPDVAAIKREFTAYPTSRSLAIAFRCVQCKITPAQIRACSENTCALYRLRPFQFDVAPAGAPHVAGHFDEIPSGIDPTDGDSDE